MKFVRVFNEDMKHDLLVNNWVALKSNYKLEEVNVYYFFIKDIEYLNKFSESDYEITSRITF